MSQGNNTDNEGELGDEDEDEDEDEGEDEDKENTKPTSPRLVKLIDFAHTKVATGEGQTRECCWGWIPR